MCIRDSTHTHCFTRPNKTASAPALTLWHSTAPIPSLPQCCPAASRPTVTKWPRAPQTTPQRFSPLPSPSVFPRSSVALVWRRSLLYRSWCLMAISGQSPNALVAPEHLQDVNDVQWPFPLSLFGLQRSGTSARRKTCTPLRLTPASSTACAMRFFISPYGRGLVAFCWALFYCSDLCHAMESDYSCPSPFSLLKHFSWSPATGIQVQTSVSH